MADPVTPARVRVVLRRSLIGRTEDQRRTVRALGLRRVGAHRVHRLTPSLEGALRKVGHLVAVEREQDVQLIQEAPEPRRRRSTR